MIVLHCFCVNLRVVYDRRTCLAFAMYVRIESNDERNAQCLERDSLSDSMKFPHELANKIDNIASTCRRVNIKVRSQGCELYEEKELYAPTAR